MPEPGDISGDSLSLVAPEPAPASTRPPPVTYRHTYGHYAKIFGFEGTDPDRKLKRWVKTGRTGPDGQMREVADLPPFDQLDEMAAWWRRNMDHRVPEYLLRLETAGGGGTSTAPAAGEQPSAPAKAPGEEQLPAMDLRMGTFDEDLGLQQARALVNATYNQLELAIKGNKPTQAATLRREWKSCVDTLRAWEKDIVGIQEKRGAVLRTRVINSEVVEIFAVMSQSFFNALLAVAERLAPGLPYGERRSLVLKQRDACFAHLKRSRFATEWDLVSAQEVTPPTELEVPHAAGPV